MQINELFAQSRFGSKGNFMMKRITTILMAAMIGAALASGGVAAGDAGLRIGVLKCKKSGPKTNLLIHSVAPFECVFKGDGGSEKYKGESGVGLGST